MEQINITHKVYRLTRVPTAVTCRDSKTIECAKEVKRLLRREGVEAAFFIDYPDVFLVKLRGGDLPKWFLESFSEIKPRSVREVLGFDEGDLLYRFGDVSQGRVPYDILKHEPYYCPNLRRLSIEVYYERREYWNALEKLFNKHVNEPLRELVRLVPHGLKDISDLDTDSIRVALLSKETLEKRIADIAEIKSRSYGYNSLSTLQLVDGDKLLKVADGRGGEYYMANLLSGLLFRASCTGSHHGGGSTEISKLLFRAGCTPYYVELPSGVRSEYLRLPRALYIGVGLVRVGEEYAKGLAVLMTGRGDVVGYVDKDFHIKSRSMEFLEEKELEEFVNSIKAKLESYRSRMREDPGLVIVVRSRKFHEAEWRTLRRNFARHWLRLSSKKLLLMSSYKLEKVRIGPGKAVEVGRTTVDGGLRGMWLLQLRKFKSAVMIRYFYTGDDATLPLAVYIYLRSLDFTSLTLDRTSLPPVKYARNRLQWLKYML
jgi:hypothetical protein